MAREVQRGRLADVADTQRIDESRQRRFTAGGDRRVQILGGLRTHAVQPRERLRVQSVDIGDVFDELTFDELVDQFVAEAFDVDREPRGEVADGFLALRGAIETARTARHRLVVSAKDLRPARWTRCRHDDAGGIGGTSGFDDLHDLRDHVAGAPHEHGVADHHAEALHFVHVVQGRVADGDAADEHRFESCDRRNRAGPTDLKLDAEQAWWSPLPREICTQSPSAAGA